MDFFNIKTIDGCGQNCSTPSEVTALLNEIDRKQSIINEVLIPDLNMEKAWFNSHSTQSDVYTQVYSEWNESDYFAEGALCEDTLPPEIVETGIKLRDVVTSFYEFLASYTGPSMYEHKYSYPKNPTSYAEKLFLHINAMIFNYCVELCIEKCEILNDREIRKVVQDSTVTAIRYEIDNYIFNLLCNNCAEWTLEGFYPSH